MRHLYVLTGAPGSGKTTLVRELGLERHALSFDAVRALLAPTVRTDTGRHSYTISNRTNKSVQSTFADAVRSRLQSGETLVLDSTAAKHTKSHIEMAKKAGYTITYIDVQGDITDEELLERNRSRYGTEHVLESDILRIAASHRDAIRELTRLGNDPMRPEHPPVMRAVSEDEIGELARKIVSDHRIRPLDLTGISRIVVASDIQGTGSAFGQLIEDQQILTDRSVLFILAGDVLDRGTEPVLTMQLVMKLRGTGRAVFVEGNHESHLREALEALIPRERCEQTWTSLDQLRGHFKDAALRRFLAELVPAATFTLPTGEHFVITHGGLAPVVLDELTARRKGSLSTLGFAADELIYGTDPEEFVYRSRHAYSAEHIRSLEHPTITQVMGHRNGTSFESMIAPDELERLIVLEGRVEAPNDPETGIGKGALRCVSIDVTTGERTFSQYIQPDAA